MTNQQPPELFPERPVRSEFATLPRSYRIRRIVSCCVLALMVFGAAYGIYALNRAPAEIPTIKAEGPLKQKPEQPGGIDIPNQDVLAYQQIDNSAEKNPPVEHLLPPPETPQAAAPQAAAPPPPTPPSAPAIESLIAPSPSPPILTTVTQKPKAEAQTDVAPAPTAAPTPTVTAQVTAPNLETSQTPPPSAPPGTQADFPKPVHEVEVPPAKHNFETASTPEPSGKKGFRIQLASFPDIETARHQMTHMEKRYASQLGDAKIHIAKADLGKRGIYYRLQSNPITDTEARDICKAIAKIKANGCIVVKP